MNWWTDQPWTTRPWPDNHTRHYTAPDPIETTLAVSRYLMYTAMAGAAVLTLAGIRVWRAWATTTGGDNT